MNHCTICQRHYFASDSACPFCRDGKPSLGDKVQRAAIIGATALIVAGCMPQPVALYGAPPIPQPSPSPSASPSASPAP